MKSSTKYLKILFNYLFAIIIAVLLIVVLPWLIGYFWPFVVAAIIASIANPLVRFLEKKMKIKRRAGSVVVIILTLAAVVAVCYGVIYLLVTEIIGFASTAPDMWENVRISLQGVWDEFSRRFALLPVGTQKFFDDIGTGIYDSLSSMGAAVTERAAQSAGNGVRNAPFVLVGIIICILASYLFVAEREQIGKFLKRVTPEHIKNRLEIVAATMKSAVGGYFKAQFKIMCVVYVVLFIGLLILRVRYAFLIALLIALLDFLPFFGTGTVMWPWALYALLQRNYRFAIGMLVVWGLSQAIRQFIQPKLVGDSLGMPAIPTLFLLYIGLRWGGALGLILAVPAGMIVYNLYKAGLFSNFIYSTKMLLADFRRMRIFTSEELLQEGIEESDTGLNNGNAAKDNADSEDRT